ncbi:MAG: hypothetical protein J6M39_09140 [Lachnospiraceae bacterium]|nr:hypothetical protein [Lachnospiraceae bacterium]
MSKENIVTIFVRKSDLNEKIIDKLIPNKKVYLDVQEKRIKLNAEHQNISFKTNEIKNITESGEYYIELVKAKLSCFDSQSRIPFILENLPPIYKYDRLIIQLYLSKEKRNLDCKIYNVGNYSEEIPYKYLTNNETYKELYNLSICNTKKIVNKNRIVSTEYSSYNNYEYYYMKEKKLLSDFDNNKSLYDKYNAYTKSNKVINMDTFNNANSYVKRLEERLNIISKSLKTLLKHKADFSNYFNEFKYEEKKLIELADKEHDYRKVYCDKGWIGDNYHEIMVRNNNDNKVKIDINDDDLLYYMTYINMHTLNGIIFLDDEFILKGIECYIKVDELGLYICIDNESTLEYFKRKYNISDVDFKIGKYVIIAPKHLEAFTKKYLKKYVTYKNETYILACKKRNDLLVDYEDFCNEMCKKITKLTFLHELGHMAFTGSNRTAKRESDESAANWFASIGLDVVEKYRIYLKTRMQPVEYQNFFTNTALLPGGKLFKSTKELEDACNLYNTENDKAIIDYKDKCNFEYYKKVKDMIDDMYLP